MKKILFILSLAILIPFIGNSQKYHGVQSLRAESSDEVVTTDDAVAAGKWLSWTTYSGSWCQKFNNSEKYGPFLRFAVEDLTDYVCQKITKIRYKIANAQSVPTIMYANPKVQIYMGGSVDFSDPDNPEYNPGNLIIEKVVDSYVLSQFNNIELATPITIPANKELWFGVIYYPEDGYPMLTIDYEKPAQLATCHPYKSDLVYFEDEDMWLSMTELESANPISWVQGVWLEIEALCATATDLKAEYNDVCVAVLNWNAPADNPNAEYHIFRDNVKLTTNGPIQATTYTDDKLDITKIHTWEVKVVCTGCGLSEAASVNLPVCVSCPAPTNFVAQYINNCEAVELKWNSTGEKFNVWRDGEKIASEIVEKTYIYAESASDKPHTWKVETVCELVNPLPSATQTVSKCVGINENEIIFSIVPNPATDKITITSATTINSIEVINFLGQTVISQMAGTTNEVDIANLTNGVYFVRVVAENGTSVQKFVKK